jgi:uncharacterized membrane protein
MTDDAAVKKEFASFLWVSSLSLLGGGALVAVRFALTDRFFYYFLIWNLALALIPYGISVAIFRASRRPYTRTNTIALTALCLLWLVFYPNAPYIFTDFIHIVNRTFVRSRTDILEKETLLWFDLVLCSAFAYLGHSAGLLSIELVFRSFKGVLRPSVARALVALAIALAGFGIYAGRFVRFNSWDLITHPLRTVSGLLPYLGDGKAILLSFAFSAFILLTYAAHHLTRRGA